jgi:hypothetical protein
MVKYLKKDTDFFYCPALPEGNFLNDTGGAIQALGQANVLPYALLTEDLPIILPQRQDEGASGVGEGRNETVVLENQFTIGAGSIPNNAINFLMIPKIGGAVATTYTATEVFVITCPADVSSSLNNTYFEFDIQLDNNTIKKYFVWFNIAGAGVEPTPAVPYGGARTAVPVAVAENATANTVAAAVHAAINALTDVSSVNTGAPSAIVTVTLDNAGAVDDAHDVNSGCTFSITTQGRTKVVIVFDADSYEMQNFGFQTQRSQGSYDTMYTQTGCSIAEHILQCEHDGMMSEEISYMIAGLKEQYGALTLLSKMRDPYGVQWAKGLSAFGNNAEVKNHNWATVNENFTFTYNTDPFSVIWMGFKVAIENELSHDRSGGGVFASGVNLNKRNCMITIHIQPDDEYRLFQISRLHVTDYTGDVLIQIKSMQAGDNNVYVQFDCDKCRILPFDEKVNADGSPEEYEIEMRPAPGATYSYTIEGYLSNEYFGGHSA